MAKVMQPSINLTLRTNKSLSDGTHPIMLRVAFNGMKEKATGYSVDEAHWDKANQCIRRGYPNYKTINDELLVIKTASTNEMLRQKLNGKGFDIAIILRPESLISDNVDNSSSNKLSGLIETYIASHSLKKNTLSCWRVLKNHLKECFYDDASKWDIDTYILFCKSKGLSSSTMSMLMGKIRALRLEMKNVPTNQFKCATRNHYIPKQTMVFLKKRLLDMMVIMDESRYTYRDEFIESFELKNGLRYNIWSLYIYYLLYVTALSPIDLALLKKSNVDILSVKDNDYYVISGYRSKTGVSFKVSLKRTMENNIIIGSLMMFTKGEYLTPICSGLTDFERCNQRQRNTINRCSKHLKEHFRAINEDIVRHNVEEKDNVPLIDMECTYYSARHSRATQIFNSPSATPAMLSQMMGRSANNIATYLHQLQNEQDLAQMADITEI